MSKKKNLVEAKITLNAKDYQKELDKVAKETQAKNEQIKKSNENLANESIKSLDKIKFANIDLTKSYGNLRAVSVNDMNKIKEAVIKVKDTNLTTSDNIKKTNVETANSFKVIKSEATGVKGVFETVSLTMQNTISTAESKVKSSLEGMKTKFKELVSDSEKGKKALENFATSAQNAGATIEKAGNKLTNSISKPLAVSGTIASTLATNFEFNFAKVSTLIDLNEKELEDYKNKLLKTAEEAGVAPSLFAEALYQAISAGVDFKEAIEFVADASDLARGGFTDITSAVMVLTSVTNSYGKEAGSSKQIMDRLIATQNKGTTTVNELAGAMKDILTPGRQANVSLDQILASMASITNQATPTAQAGTMLRQMLLELGDTGSEVGKILQEKTGKSFKQLMEDGKDLPEVLKLLEDHAKSVGLELTNLFSSSEAGIAGAKILTDEAQSYKTALDAIGKSAGEAVKASEKMSETAKGQIEQTMVSMQTTLIKLGEELAPLLDSILEFANKLIDALGEMDFEAVLKPFLKAGDKLIDILSKLVDWFANLDEGTQDFIAKTVVMTGLFAPLISIVGSVIGAVGNLTFALTGFSKFFETGFGKVLISVGGAIGKTFSGLGGILKTAFTAGIPAALSFAAANLPIVLAVGAIIGVIALLVKNWEKVKEVATNVSEAITDKWTEFKDWFSGIWDNLKDTVSKAWEWITQAVEEGINFIGDLFKLAFDIITLPWRFIWENFGGILTEKLTEAYNFIATKFEEIKEFLAPFGEAIQEKWLEITTKAQEAWDNITNYLTTKWTEIKDKSVEIFTQVRDSISEKWNEMTSYVSEKWEVFTTWISEKTTEIKETVTGKFTELKENVIEVFDTIGNWFTERWNKISESVSKVVENIKKKIKETVEWLKEKFDFEWSLPKIKLPHFKIEGKFSLNPPEVPNFGIEWRHKGAIYTRPTVLANGQGVGDGYQGMGAQAEAVLPIEKLPDLLGLNQRKGGDFNLNIENFNNEREQDIDQLVKEISYFARKRGFEFAI